MLREAVEVVANVLESHRVFYAYESWDGRNENYRAECRTCGIIGPAHEAPSQDAHQAEALEKAGLLK